MPLIAQPPPTVKLSTATIAGQTDSGRTTPAENACRELLEYWARKTLCVWTWTRWNPRAPMAKRYDEASYPNAFKGENMGEGTEGVPSATVPGWKTGSEIGCIPRKLRANNPTFYPLASGRDTGDARWPRRNTLAAERVRWLHGCIFDLTSSTTSRFVNDFLRRSPAHPSQNGDETDVDCGGSSCARCPSGYKCLVDSDCTYNNCPEPTSATDDQICISPAKACPNGCGGATRGSCEYFSSTSGAALNATNCLADTPTSTCRASCACFDSYGGEGCQYSDAQLAAAVKVRQQSLSFIQASAKNLDVSRDSISRQAVLLSKVRLRFSELSVLYGVRKFLLQSERQFCTKQ